ncbi:MAG: hypothetical protein ACRCW2_06260, partial [Cellulosilyticaceae bacterium]
ERDGFKVGDVVKVSIQADGRTQTFEYQLKSGMSVQTPALVEEVAYKIKGQVLVNGKPAPGALVGVRRVISKGESTRKDGVNAMYADKNGYFDFDYVLPYKEFELWASYQSKDADYKVVLEEAPIGQQEQFILNVKPVTSVTCAVTNKATGNGIPQHPVNFKVGYWRSSTTTDAKGVVTSVGAVPMEAGDTIEIEVAGHDQVYSYTLKEGKNKLPTIAIQR